MFTCTTLGLDFHMKSLSCTALQNLRNPPSLMSMGHDIPTSELMSGGCLNACYSEEMVIKDSKLQHTSTNTSHDE